MLTDLQCNTFQHDGFLGEAAFIPPSLLTELQDEVFRLLDSARPLSGNTDRYDLAPEHRPDAVLCRRIKDPFRFSPVFVRLLASDAVGNIARALLGPDIYLSDMPLNMKPPLDDRTDHPQGNEIGWHQDWAFEPLSNDNAITLTVALCDCTLDNGALQVVPGTHKSVPLYRHGSEEAFTGAVDPTDPAVPWERTRVLPVRAGSISVHHTRLLHGSGLNRTNRHRPLQAIGLRAADAWPTDQPMTLEAVEKRLICGRALTPRHDASVPQPNLPPRAVESGSLFDLQQASRFSLFRP